MKNFQTFSEFVNEGNKFGISFDATASRFDDKNKATKSDKAPKFKDIYDSSDLKKLGIIPAEYNKWNAYISMGLKTIKTFVDKTDFSQFAANDDRSTNWDDKAYIYHTLTGWLGGYSNNTLSLAEIAYIGMEESLKEFDVKNENWVGKFGMGSTDNFPERRPQLRLQGKHQKSWYAQDIINALPSLENFPRLKK